MKQLKLAKGALCMTLSVMATVSLAATGPNFVTGTHTVKGMLKNIRNVVLPASSQVRIQAADKGGHVIAATTVCDPSDDGYNFALFIPLSQTATDCTAAVDDELICVFTSDNGISVATSPVKVGETDACSEFKFVFLDVTTVTNRDDSTQIALVPNAYLEEIEAYLESEMQYGGKKYDPWGDYDGDGALNYAEYLAGTNPFDPSDKLRITAFDKGAKAAIGFEYVGGHLYGVKATPTLVNPEWLTRRASTTAEGAEHDQVMPSANEDDIGTATIYVTPTVGAQQEFFAIEAK